MNGTPNPRKTPIRSKRPIAERFHRHVDKTDTCWLWTAYVNAYGYGTFKVDAVSNLAHRVSYEMDGSVIPEGAVIDHTCHVRHCVNKAHMRLVTRKQNAEHRTGAQVNSKSGVRGVYQDKHSGRWIAQIKHNGIVIYLGRFPDMESAAEAARLERLKHFTHNDHDRVQRDAAAIVSAPSTTEQEGQR